MIRFYEASFEAAYGTFAQLPVSDLQEIAFAGRSNVGKSSMLNKIFNRKLLARVSGKPGKTITVNFYKTGDVRFADLPGYGYAQRAKSEKLRWGELMEGYFTSGRNISLVVQLIDMRHPPTKDDLDMLKFLREMEYPFVVVLTKSDKLNKTEYSARLASLGKELDFFDGVRIIPFSAVSGEGVAELKEVIEKSI